MTESQKERRQFRGRLSLVIRHSGFVISAMLDMTS